MRTDMKSMISRIAAVVALLVSAPLFAAGGGALPYSYTPELGNEASLQRGAKLFMNYCSGCHGLQYLRYNRMAEDLEIPEDLLTDNLIFTGAKPGEHINTAMPSEPASVWFGQAPPDLSLTARSRGPSWIYSYLLTFYLDESRPMGVNNVVLPGASMPNVLAELEGWKAMDEHHGGDASHGEPSGGHGGGHEPAFVEVEPGTLEQAEFRAAVGDITNFLTYAAEPGKRDRQALGFKVIAYLIVLFILSWLLKREFWKDVH